MSSADIQVTGALLQLPETRAVRLELVGGTTLAEVDQELGRAAEIGFNVVVVSAFARGFACFPSGICAAAGLPRRHPTVYGRDCLADITMAARHRGLAVYASVSTLNAGPTSRFPRSPFLGRRSEWLLRSHPRPVLGAKRWKVSPERSSSEDAIWLCPVIPAVRQFFASLAGEIAAAYPVDGVLLDGLCYPSSSISDDFCGCRTCTQRVAMELGIHLKDGWPEPGSESHGRWTHWRAARLTEFVESIKARARKGRRSVRVAGVVGRDQLAQCADPTILATTDWVQQDMLDIFCWHHRPKESVASETSCEANPTHFQESPDIWWEEMTVPTGVADWEWPARLHRNRGGILVRWSGTPTDEDRERARSWLTDFVPPLESAPLTNVGLLLNHAAALGALGCAEVVLMTTAVAERDRDTEPAGARLDRLLGLLESLDRVRLQPEFAGEAASDPTKAEEAMACMTSAAGLVRLALMST